MYLKRKALAAALLLLPLILLGCPSLSAQQDSDAEQCRAIITAWESIRGYPYVWGGESVKEGGFDCSGAIYHVQKAIGRPVPRTTSAKYYILAAGPEKHWTEAGCGDWIWWQFSAGRPYGHIGMHVKQPHAWQSGSSTGPTEITLFKGGYWDKRFKATKCPGK